MKSENKLSHAEKQKNRKGFSKFIHSIGGKILIVIFSLLILSAGTMLVMAHYFLSKIDYTPLDSFSLASDIPSDETDSDADALPTGNDSDLTPVSGDILSDSNIQNILLIGSDNRGGEKYGRSDSMILVSIDKANNQIKLTSFLRDLYVQIDGMQDNRINAAYAYGGPKLLIDTIQNNFKVKIDNYVSTDFTSFEKMIDLLGGVDITLTQKEADELNQNPGHYDYNGGLQTVTAGTQHLNGATALGYSRIRYIDSDFGRTQRQRTVLSSIITSMKSSSPSTLMNAANQILPLVQTDLTSGQILSLATEAPAMMKNDVQTFYVPPTGDYQSMSIRKMAVLVPNREACKEALWKFIYNK